VGAFGTSTSVNVASADHADPPAAVAAITADAYEPAGRAGVIALMSAVVAPAATARVIGYVPAALPAVAVLRTPTVYPVISPAAIAVPSRFVVGSVHENLVGLLI